MPINVVVPQLGESVIEGTVSKWLKQEGESIQRDEPLLEIMTDKITMEIPSPGGGVLEKILAPEGTVVPVGKEIGIISGEGAGTAPELKAEREIVQAPPPTAPGFKGGVEESEEGPHRTSPVVRRLAREYGVELSRIRGTGLGGRVTRKDLLAFLAKKPAAPAPVRVTAPSPGGEEVIPLTGVRKLIAEHMVKSRHTAAHTLTIDEVDMTRLVSLRQSNKDAVKEKYGVKLTYMPFLIKATVWALKEHPWVNASIVEDQIVVKRYYHIGMAVARDLGLIVPVIHDADQKTLLEIAKEVEDLAERARQDKLTLSEIQGGTFTITNAGGYGAILSAPVINWPEVAILGVHQIQERPVVVNHEVAVRWMMYLSLSFDHRLVDGSLAVSFLQRLKQYLENPDQWLVDAMMNVI